MQDAHDQELNHLHQHSGGTHKLLLLPLLFMTQLLPLVDWLLQGPCPIECKAVQDQDKEH
jgi:hypothetical protein